MKENTKIAEVPPCIKITEEMVTRFLNWPLPKSVRPDPCAMNRDHPDRIGTNLLTADEARQMLTHVLQEPPVPVGMVRTTATCVGCNLFLHAPTTGVVMDRCPVCGEPMEEAHA